MPFISIIVPVYCVEKFLTRCVDSILHQTFSDFELILVDDGSPDSCGKICDEFAKLDRRVIVIHTENRGLSSARNMGLKNATASHIAFVDSDDYVSPDYLEAIHDTFASTQADCVFFERTRVAGGEILSVHSLPVLTGSYIDQLIALTQADMFGYVWLKAYRRDIIGTIQFDPDIKLFEDEVFSCAVLAKPCKLVGINKSLYYQTVVEGSLSRRRYEDYYQYCDAVYKAWDRMLICLHSENCPILTEKANHMALVCKYHALECVKHPLYFYKKWADCAFMKTVTLNDALVQNIKAHKVFEALCKHYVYNLKIFLKRIFGG